MTLTRCGGRSDRGIDLRGTWTPPIPPSLRSSFELPNFPSSARRSSRSPPSPEEAKERLKAGLEPSSEAAFSAQDWIPASRTGETWAWEPTAESGTALEPEPEQEGEGQRDITDVSGTTPGAASLDEAIDLASSALESVVTTAAPTSDTRNETNYTPPSIPVLVQCKYHTKSGPKYLRELEGTLGLVAPNTPAIGILCATTSCTPGLRKHLVMSRRALVFAFITPPEFSMELGDNMPPEEEGGFSKLDAEAEEEFNEAERRRKEAEEAEEEATRGAMVEGGKDTAGVNAGVAGDASVDATGESAVVEVPEVATIPWPPKKKRGRPKKSAQAPDPEEVPQISAEDIAAQLQAALSATPQPPSSGSDTSPSLHSISLSSGGVLKQLLWNKATAELIGRGVGVGERFIEGPEGLRTEVIITVDGVAVEETAP
ncbi:Similar to hypothetical protein AOL_s00109g124 [Arthrobotrys oligospora ATCC 24927]; acc. no. EGX46552 [Pyronema omphalodes CBS 100304]|uniref:Restriction endonuclease type IV Mrr domain-containing protein n=1 Tax=Pyronema omphalodes (strain CBS 100304) TaxID=1076935 RepID=U4L537_PYROM|nr:Similar to hypothetical protein AOL_s00109g124 [Arthrobotrys oligospora ATCC 24927]; acc. no. EGX46552 [Pyronema omphalodes CBS 100304]